MVKNTKQKVKLKRYQKILLPIIPILVIPTIFFVYKDRYDLAAYMLVLMLITGFIYDFFERKDAEPKEIDGDLRRWF